MTPLPVDFPTIGASKESLLGLKNQRGDHPFYLLLLHRKHPLVAEGADGEDILIRVKLKMPYHLL